MAFVAESGEGLRIFVDKTHHFCTLIPRFVVNVTV
jgi:hypothetical protein